MCRAEHLATIREFGIGAVLLTVHAVPDYDVDLSWDETGEVREKLETGELQYFAVRATLYWDGVELANDYLGGCIYASPAEFQDHRLCGKETRRLRESGSNAVCGSYFANMVRNVIREGRERVRKIQALRVRAV